ncbi:hypothetical protein PENFLA_c038G09954 [Penicillium flavigenum]|uniref:Uncharacterized protein n=1 Tax=Penicillium flavigenum TaxID=254877 RepID=A0A1V6SK57_9EURO|nr:hypothetical protein PENFLA_c038G09954 [Penicillium flavigenum]
MSPLRISALPGYELSRSPSGSGLSAGYNLDESLFDWAIKIIDHCDIHGCFISIRAALYIHLLPRYQVTKLMEVLFTRELVANLSLASVPLLAGKAPAVLRLVRRILDRTTEVGSRSLVLGASAPASSHGEFQSDGANQDVEKKVFEQTLQILEAKKSGIAH